MNKSKILAVAIQEIKKQQENQNKELQEKRKQKSKVYEFKSRRR